MAAVRPPPTLSIALILLISISLLRFALPTKRKRPKVTPSTRLSHLHSISNLKAGTYTVKHPPKERPLHPPTFHLEVYDAAVKVCRVHNACIQNDNTLFVHPWLKAHEATLTECGISQLAYFNPPDYNNSSIDLLNAEPLRDHMPHFLTDLLSLMYGAATIRNGSRNGRATCYSPSGGCQPDVAKRNSAFFMNDRIKGQRMRSWVPMVARMLQPRLQIHWMGSPFTCFRSVSSVDRHAYLNVPSSFYESNRVFRRHGIERRRREGRCVVKILNRSGWRKVRRIGNIAGRDITNVEEVAQKVRQVRGVQRVDVEYFENYTVPEQKELMQDGDIFIAAHGAGLANLIFARSVPLLEVLPFGYYVGLFGDVGRAFGMTYEDVIGKPDMERVENCFKYRVPEDKRDEVIRTWREAAEKWTETKLLLQDHPEFAVRACVRAQRVEVDVGVVLDWVERTVKEACR